MKHALIIVIVCLCLNAQAEIPQNIITYFKRGEINKIIMSSTFPFNISVGSKVDDPNILTGKLLRDKLKFLIGHDFFRATKLEKAKKVNEFQWNIRVRSFNRYGELESESNLIFFFKKVDKNYKLSGVAIAG